ncbi:hypothetical protein AGABI2DRAFT_190709 [Agaricus bisporus var. bisporus H97]|uniref:hypothetical protein n=1 Tax=Agaricus bisporus var. bisporus (strain H97 / ATCC MYA-4626 / FGSC 10389) TaxID=936046 RepID=UPI00029F6A37|nr:hypothetical protein AGABI2DRAFT_190709 [Agaricus bisporus var. bisporus H97]EKV50386.1 hypothetical protein AGABI2DRAFT_190709 [Agaricus bisporus var. bisporus H97]
MFLLSMSESSTFRPLKLWQLHAPDCNVSWLQVAVSDLCKEKYREVADSVVVIMPAQLDIL